MTSAGRTGLPQAYRGPTLAQTTFEFMNSQNTSELFALLANYKNQLITEDQFNQWFRTWVHSQDISNRFLHTLSMLQNYSGVAFENITPNEIEENTGGYVPLDVALNAISHSILVIQSFVDNRSSKVIDDHLHPLETILFRHTQIYIGQTRYWLYVRGNEISLTDHQNRAHEHTIDGNISTYFTIRVDS